MGVNKTTTSTSRRKYLSQFSLCGCNVALPEPMASEPPTNQPFLQRNLKQTFHNLLAVGRVKVHLKLDNLIVQVNGCFGPLIVCTVLSSFVVLTLQLFNLYKVTSTTSERAWHSNDSFKLTYTLLRIGVHSAKVLLILYPIHQGQRERDRTGTVLYRFASHQESKGSTHDALMLFAGQLLHGKGHYRACGLITLDLTLISKIVASLTTYLVILIQFDSASKVQIKEVCARYLRISPSGIQSKCKQ
ncbi:putative gustatory receptor 28b [Anopheles maculipalpis]|uniref:putative gustatory receptor 28b n=1 Tax=Anopheles maculipalpis TaxID=1496333 RepID=UPI002159AF99|nr:putative gustatory receptor 28b [Anopheles maculipalpis]